MNGQIAQYLDVQRVSVLSVFQNDSSIHAATLHFAHQKETNSFLFLTSKNSKKCASLLSGESTTAALVIGFNEEEFVTFQAEGNVAIVDQESAWEVYLAKYPTRASRRENPETVLLEFIPQWWRFTDMKTDPPTTISSEQ